MERYCQDCSRNRTQIKAGIYCCMTCGETAYGLVSGYIPNIRMYQKSNHSRSKWFKRCVEGVVGYHHVDILTGDFEKVLRVMIDNSLVNGNNVSKYGYYIIRLTSRRGIKLIATADTPKDLKHGKTKQIFDDRLFGQVYRLLDWDTDPQTHECSYYSEWALRNKVNRRNLPRKMVPAPTIPQTTTIQLNGNAML